MEIRRRSVGLLGLAVFAATVVVMVALAILDPGQVSWGVAFGLIAGVLLTLALLYIFFGRLNSIQKTGYASLLGVVLIAIFIPLFWLGQNSSQSSFQADTYQLNLKRGAALYGTYCLSCHGATGQGGKGPILNGSYPNSPVTQLTDDDVTRIISAGVPTSLDPTKLGNQGLAMPAWSELYGGPLTADDISYLVALIRSSEPTYLKTNHINDMTNGFTYVYGQLTTQAQVDLFNQNCIEPSQNHSHCKQSSGYGPVVDMTKTNQVKMNIGSDPANPSGFGFQFTNITIKVGTTVTWTNVSAAPHTVTGQGTSDATFNTGSPILTQNDQGAASVYTFTFTKPGTYDYYCTLHPTMLAQITVVA